MLLLLLIQIKFEMFGNQVARILAPFLLIEASEEKKGGGGDGGNEACRGKTAFMGSETE